GMWAARSAVGMFCAVLGSLQAGVNNTLFVASVVTGIALLLGFYAYIRRLERAGGEPRLSTRLFRNRVCNLALGTQNLQWLIMMGTSFVVSVYLQEVHGYSPIRTGLIFTSATAGILISSFAARGLV